MLAYVWLSLAPAARAVTLDENTAASEDAPSLSLVFSDDFSTNPNTNGQWTIHRHEDDPTSEAAWDPAAQVWHLTRPVDYRAVAVFANYELTATKWRAEFRYKVGKLGGVNGGGDGFVFMFYKDKNAYGKPDFGTSMGFEVGGLPVEGYGLEFDNYDSGAGCDPTPNDYIALIKDKVCNSAFGGREDDRTDDNIWHTVQFAFDEGRIRISINGDVIVNYQLANPDYTFSGVGFAAGTGAAVADHVIDNFRLWVLE